MKIASIVSYCTNDFRFLSKCIEELKKFSHKIIIPVCDHFYNGQEENRDLLSWSYEEDAEFLEFAYYKDQLYSNYIDCAPGDKYWNLCWHGIPRYIGFLHVPEECDYVLFLDIDEIIDGEKWADWLEKNAGFSESALRFASYLYFRKAHIQSTFIQSAPLLVKKECLQPSMIINHGERSGVFERIEGSKKTKVLGLDGFPMCHHYSWVKTKEEMFKKTETWGHFWEEDWHTLIEKEFSHDFQGKDFYSDHTYRFVEPFFDPLSVKIPTGKSEKPRCVQKILYNDVVKKDLMFEFGVELN